MRNSRTRLAPILMGIGANLLLMLSTSLHAQYENGSLLGTVLDASGAPISGANVSVVNTATGTTNQSKTDAAGNYDVPQLRRCVYSDGERARSRRQVYSTGPCHLSVNKTITALMNLLAGA